MSKSYGRSYAAPMAPIYNPSSQRSRLPSIVFTIFTFIGTFWLFVDAGIFIFDFLRRGSTGSTSNSWIRVPSQICYLSIIFHLLHIVFLTYHRAMPINVLATWVIGGTLVLPFWITEDPFLDYRLYNLLYLSIIWGMTCYTALWHYAAIVIPCELKCMKSQINRGFQMKPKKERDDQNVSLFNNAIDTGAKTGHGVEIRVEFWIFSVVTHHTLEAIV